MTFKSLLESKWLPRLLWLALLAQMLLAFWVSRPWIVEDSADYLELSAALTEGHYSAVTEAGLEPDVLRPPGYPLFLALFHNGLGIPIPGIVLIQLSAYALSLGMAQRLLRSLGRSPVPLLAIAAIYPFPALYIARIMGEGLATLAVTTIAFLLATSSGHKPFNLALAGLLAGIAALLRSDLVLLPLVLAGAVVIHSLVARRGLAHLLGNAALPVLTAGLVLLPYATWNHVTHGKFTPVPLAGAVGNSLYLSTWQNELPPEDIQALYHQRVTAKARETGLAAEVAAVNKEIGAAPFMAPWNPINYPTRDTQVRSTHITLQAALTRIEANPSAYARHVLSNVWKLWNTSQYPPSVPDAGRLLLALTSAAVTLLGFGGILLSLLRVKHWPLSITPTLILLYVPAVHVWLHTEARYTAPVRVLLLLHAALFIWWCFARWRERSGSGTPLTQGSML